MHPKWFAKYADGGAVQTANASTPPPEQPGFNRYDLRSEQDRAQAQQRLDRLGLGIQLNAPKPNN